MLASYLDNETSSRQSALIMLARTSGPRLHPWAAKLNWKAELSSITLANVLSGDTCSPISLEDFERYLTYNEHSVETLQFLVWFQDYRERFPKVHSAKHDFALGTSCHAEIERRATESIRKMEEMEYIQKYPTAATADVNSLGPSSITSTPTAEDALLRTACSRAVATFLSPNASKELPVDALVRDTVIRTLAYDCHPDVFLPVYEEVYNLLERHSLPTFLARSSSNTDRRIQMILCDILYCVGYLTLVLGLITTIILTMLLPTPPETNRCWRLLTAVLFSLGSMQCYAAWRGFCGVLCIRGVKQLNEWDMQEMSEDTMIFIGSILGPRAVQLMHTSPKDENCNRTDSQCCSGDDVKRGSHASLAVFPSRNAQDIVTIAPFTNLEPSDITSSRATSKRPPRSLSGPFGPVTAVLDPRIKAVHRQVFGETIMVGLIVMLVFSSVVLSIPGRPQVG